MENKLMFIGEVKFISKSEIVLSKDKSKEYVKQYFIAADTKEYPNEMMFELFNKPDHLSGIHVGDNVEVEFNTSVKEYNGKHFCAISAWKVNRLVGNAPSNTAGDRPTPSNERVGKEELPMATTNDSLPF